MNYINKKGIVIDAIRWDGTESTAKKIAELTGATIDRIQRGGGYMWLEFNGSIYGINRNHYVFICPLFGEEIKTEGEVIFLKHFSLMK